MKKHLDLYVVNGMYWVTAAAFLPFIGAYYTSIGMTDGQVGVLAAVFPLAALVIQPFWAYLSDRTGKRKRMLLGLCAASGAAVLLFLRADSFWKCFFAIFLYAAFSTALLPLCDALVIEAAKKRGADFSRIRMAGTDSYAVAVVLIGALAGDSFRWIFLFGGISYVAYFLCCCGLREGADEKIPGCSMEGKSSGYLEAEMPEDAPRKRKDGTGKASDAPRKRQKAGRTRLFRSSQIFAVLLFAFALQLGLMYHGTFLGVYLVDLGFDNGMIGVMNCVSALSEVPVLFLINRIRKKAGIMRLLFLAVVLCALRLFLVSTGNVVWMLPAQLLQGPSYMVSYFCCVMYVSENVLDGRISQGQSLLTMVQTGLGAICGSLAGGFAAERLGTRGGFLAVGCLILILAAAAAVLDRYLRRRREADPAMDV